MSRYIDADKFVGNLKTDHWGVTNMVEVGIAIDKSVADVEEVRHGEWLEQFKYSRLVKCSVCGYEYCDLIECDNYCGHCGAKMD
jgi:hypothetical protein